MDKKQDGSCRIQKPSSSGMINTKAFFTCLHTGSQFSSKQRFLLLSVLRYPKDLGDNLSSYLAFKKLTVYGYRESHLALCTIC